MENKTETKKPKVIDEAARKLQEYCATLVSIEKLKLAAEMKYKYDKYEEIFNLRNINNNINKVKEYLNGHKVSISDINIVGDNDDDVDNDRIIIKKPTKKPSRPEYKKVFTTEEIGILPSWVDQYFIDHPNDNSVTYGVAISKRNIKVVTADRPQKRSSRDILDDLDEVFSDVEEKPKTIVYYNYTQVKKKKIDEDPLKQALKKTELKPKDNNLSKVYYIILQDTPPKLPPPTPELLAAKRRLAQNNDLKNLNEQKEKKDISNMTYNGFKINPSGGGCF